MTAGWRWTLAAAVAVVVVTTMVMVPGGVRARQDGVIEARTSEALHQALLSAQPGQTIELTPGRVYNGPFVLPLKGTSTEWITIRSGASRHRLPREGVRVTPEDARAMATLRASSGSVIRAAPGAHHYRFVGVEVAPAPGVFLYDVIDLGTDHADPADIPHHFDFQRVYVHGDPTAGSRRGFALNSAHTSIVDSYVADFKEVGADSQAICGWNGPGPFQIINNYLEGAGETLMFGGGDPTVPNLVPSDIEIRRNHLTKPLTWRPDKRPAGQPAWTVKNVLELKNARRVVIDGNLIEHSWKDGQVGFAVLFTVRNQDGRAPWSIVEDVTFSNNFVRRAAAGMDIHGTDDIHASQQTSRIRIVNNAFVEIGGEWGFGRLFQLLKGTDRVTIAHNTGLQTDAPVFGGDTTPHTNFVFENNIVPHNAYGFIGSGTPPGRASIEKYFPGAVIRGNVIAGGDAAQLPSENAYPPDLNAIGFSNLARNNVRLAQGSAFKGKATDGTDPGADLTALTRALALTERLGGDDDAEAGSLFAAIAFWLSAITIGYTFAGYPIVMVLAAGAKRGVRNALAAGLPHITIVVVAHNEEEQIAGRLQNLLEQDYPPARVEIVVVSDGSTDGTAAVAAAVDPSVRVIPLRVRRGKPAAFNAVLPQLTTGIVVLADARQRFAPDAVRKLVAHFADPEVGAASGRLVLKDREDADGGSRGARMYWGFETRLRLAESHIDSCIGVTGAICAIRRAAFESLPDDTLIDDVVIPMRITRRGYRVVFEPDAVAFDQLSPDSRDEFQRKVRTLAGVFQMFSRHRWLLVPRQNRLWFQTISHKGLRLILPVCLAALLVSNAWLLSHAFYQLTFAAQLAFYVAAACAWRWPGAQKKLRILAVPYTICLLEWATVVAFVRILRGRQAVTWRRATAT